MKKDRFDAKTAKKINRFMKFMMGFTISFALATYGVVASGHFTFRMWGLGLLLSFILTFIISVVLPVHKLADKTADKFQFRFMKKLSSAFVINFFFSFIITTVLVCVLLTMANREITSKTDDLKDELAEIEEGIQECEDKMSELSERSHEYIEVNTQCGELRDAKKGISKRIHDLESDKPSIVKTLPKSLLVSFILSFALCLVLEPIYMMIARRRYIRRPSVDDLE